MTLSQSKLMIQLNKQQKISNRLLFNQQEIDELYIDICKLQPKNLTLVEFLILIIEKDFVKNSHKLIQFVELYEQVKGKILEADHSNDKNSLQAQEQKFSLKKFIKMLKELSRRLYPGNPSAYQTILFQKLTKINTCQHRIKMDETIRKMLTKETVSTINQYDQELKSVFELYMPQNYNLNLQFKWEEIRILEKRLPIICCMRFLYEVEVVPHFLSAAQFTEIVSKLKPPIISSASGSKEAMFYTSQTMTTYLRDHINLAQIKLLQGDVGFTFFEFQIFFIKIATEFSKDSKHEFSNNIKKLTVYTKLKQAFEQAAPRRNKFMELVKAFLKNKSGKKEKVLVKKRESRKNIQDLYDSKESESKEEKVSKSTFKTIFVQPKEINLIRKDLDSELPDLPQKKKIEKQNEGFFDVERKHIIIGQQLPKIQQKTKNVGSKENKKKSEDSLLGYKSEVLKVVQNSDPIKLIARPKKLRTNSQFPIILNEIFYPSDLKNQLFISPKAEVYIQTSYIHLGERLYEQAYMSYLKAKSLNDSKSSVTQFYFNIHSAQIFESAGKDEIALSFYHKAKDLLAIITSIQGSARAHPYIGMGACFHHLDQYELAFRCFEKAKTLLGVNLQKESIENAILQNNIGCCLMMLNRNQEAVKYFQVSHKTFDVKVGVFDQRTLVVQQNLNKNRKVYLELLPEFKTMWKTYIQKSTTKLPAVKQNKQKK